MRRKKQFIEDNTNKRINSRVNKKKGKLKTVVLFFLFQAIFIPALSIMLIFYGPFKNIRDMIVTTAMTTMSHQYFATWFLDDATIAKIIQNNSPDENIGEQDINQIDVSAEKTDGKEGIEYIDVSTKSFKAHLLIISDPSRVKLVTAPRLGVVGSTTSQIVEHYDAIAGINAGGFDDDALGTGGKPSGIIISDGVLKTPKTNQAFKIVGLDTSNRMIVSNGMTYQTMVSKNIRDAVSFGPVLVMNGNPTITTGNGGGGIQPRTAIGQRKDGAIMMLVIDGRQIDSLGATLRNVQDIMLEYGAYNVFNLDGGASTTMVFDDKVTNKPSDIMGERYVPSAFIVTK